VHAPNSFACRRHLSREQSRLYVKRLAGLLSGLAFTHMSTHARISMHRETASTQALGAGEGSTVEPHRLHSATATPFSTGIPLSRVTLYTPSQHDSGPSTAPPQAELFTPLHWTPPSAATTRARRSWCRCDAQHTHGTRLWLAAVGASWRDRSCPLRVGGSVGVAMLTSGRA
jgi:hypothetical protein